MSDPLDREPDTGVGSEELLAELYEELRRLARARLARLPAGQTLQPTALVHEAYLRLAQGSEVKWNGRGHFFGAAARAMRHILVDQARRKRARKHGGDLERVDADDVELPFELPVVDLIALDQAVTRLQADDPRKGEIVLLRFFAGLEREEIAELMGISIRTVDREWRYIQARLHRELAESPGDPR